MHGDAEDTQSMQNTADFTDKLIVTVGKELLFTLVDFLFFIFYFFISQCFLFVLFNLVLKGFCFSE